MNIGKIFELLIKTIHGIGATGALLLIVGIILLSVSFKKEMEDDKKRKLEITGSVFIPIGIIGIVVLICYY